MNDRSTALSRIAVALILAVYVKRAHGVRSD